MHVLITVATVLTACGIETNDMVQAITDSYSVATVLTACGIETNNNTILCQSHSLAVATVLTACGIET